jgi:hypothetical protein
MFAAPWGAILEFEKTAAKGSRERQMTKFAIRLLTLTICATPLVALPVMTQANAATSHSKHVKKHVRETQHSSAVRDTNKNPFASKYEDDFDRKNAGGGGGY